MDNAEDYAEVEDADVGYGIVVDVAPRFTFLEARTAGEFEVYCVYSKALRDDGTIMVTWIRRPLVQ